VKVRGYRVELKEIENALREEVVVKDVCVKAVGEVNGGMRLAAYIVARGEVSGEEVRRQLRKRLPEYMVPGVVVMMEGFPLTPSGKVDRNALPEPGNIPNGSNGRPTIPGSATEEILTGIFADVLKLENVSGDDHFFDKGGHSLLATQVMSRIRKIFEMELPLASLFEHPTAARMAKLVDARQAAERGADAPPIARRERGEPPQLSFAQQRVWFMDQLVPNNPFYNIPIVARLEGSLNVNALQQAFTRLVRRHEALRTVFHSINEEPKEIILEPQEVTIELNDVSGLPEDERTAKALQIVAFETVEPFNLSQWPLFRLRLIRLGEEDHVTCLTIHHIITDLWSMGILISEISELYDAHVSGREASLAELEIQYADYAIWQREWLQGPALERQLSYWKKQLDQSRPFEFPTGRPRPKVLSHSGAVEELKVGREIAERLKALSRSEGVTLYMTLLAAFNVLLNHYTGETDLVIGSNVANRNRAEIEPLIGFFVNHLVIRTDLSGDPTFMEVLRRQRKVALEAFAHQDLPFDKLVEELQPEREFNRTPIFQTLFSLQNAPRTGLRLPGLKLRPFDSGPTITKYDLTLLMSENEDGLAGAFAYHKDLFDSEYIEKLAQYYHRLLMNIVERPDDNISRLKIEKEDEEREQVANRALRRNLKMERLRKVKRTPTNISGVPLVEKS
jgi:hypothetical protein